MKATGIVRRIDDLGRVVIPKEIRRTYRIKVGDPLEIFVEKDGGVVFRKYSPLGELQDSAGLICESVSKNTGRATAVTDRDLIVALSGAPRRDLLERPFTGEIEAIMEGRKPYNYTPGTPRIYPTEGETRFYVGAAAPVITQGDLMGCVLVLLDETSPAPTESDQKIAQIAAAFLAKQMEG